MAKIKEILDNLNSILDLPGKIAGVVVIITPVLVWISGKDLLLEVRLSVLILSAAALALFVHIGPRFFRKNRMIFLSNESVFIWNKMKTVIRKFHDPNLTDSEKRKLQQKYTLFRKQLMQIVAFNQEKILGSLELERPGANNYAPVVKHNFENCFFAEKLSDWSTHCKRNIEHELNSFDSLVAKIATFH